MIQRKFRVRSPLGTKLLISLVTLVFAMILFLNISSIYLFRADKKSYTYQAQADEAFLAGKNFVSQSQYALDTLRIFLSSINPNSEITTDIRNRIQTILDNQSKLFSTKILKVNKSTGESTTYIEINKEKTIQTLKINLSDYSISPLMMQIALKDLLKQSYAFLNVSKIGSHPTLAILLSEANPNDPQMLTVSVGLTSLQELAEQPLSYRLTIATRSGWILYDSDPTSFYSHENISKHELFQKAIQSRLSNGATEFDANQTHWLGSYVTPGLDLVTLTTTEWSKAMQATYMLTEKFILLGSIAIGAAILFSIFFAKSLTAPIERLYRATKEIAAGNFLLKLDETGQDEIGALSKSFNTMSRQIGELIEEKTEKVRLEKEVEIASTIQQTLLPPVELKSDTFHIYSHYQAATKCGGDWWGTFQVGRQICLMIADATGHGLPSALMTASVRSCFSVLQKSAQEHETVTLSPAEMLSYANRVIFDTSQGKLMMTLFIGVIDLNKKTLTYASAGHNPQWLFSYHEKSDTNPYQIKSLLSGGRRLGELETLEKLTETTLQLTSKDILFLYTDGLIEGTNKTGEQFSKKKTRQMLVSHLEQGPQEMVQTLIKSFFEFNQGKPLDDDITCAAAQFTLS